MTVFHIVVPVRRCSASAPQGEATHGWYRVDKDAVIITTEDGISVGTQATLKPGDDARVIAARLLKRRWEDQRGSDFDRPLGHGDYDRWRY